jgi:dihydropyrimidinase
LTALDLVLRNARAATAADVGRIVALGQGLPAGAREIDAAGRSSRRAVSTRTATSTSPRRTARMADDFVTGTRSAACGGTTTVIPFAAQFKGAVAARRGGGLPPPRRRPAAIDYAFHLIVSDPTPRC